MSMVWRVEELYILSWIELLIRYSRRCFRIFDGGATEEFSVECWRSAYDMQYPQILYRELPFVKLDNVTSFPCS